MGLRCSPDSPSSGDGRDDPGRTETVCCWCADYQTEVSVESHGRYMWHYKADGTRHNYSFPKTFKIEVPAATGTEITVRLRVKVEPQSGVAAADVATCKSNLLSGVSSHWDNVFTIAARDPAAECAEKSFRVRFVVEWVSSGQHYTMKVHQTYAREGLTGFELNVSRTTSAWTYAHEVAHCFGVPDEYSYTADVETVRHIKPDGTEDAAVSCPPNGKPTNAPDATIMAAVNNTVVLVRHGWTVAIEAQTLLRANLGRQIECVVSK